MSDPGGMSYDMMAEDLRQHYQTTGSRDLEEAEDRLHHLDTFFSGKRVAAISSAAITAYVGKRQIEERPTGRLIVTWPSLGR